MAKEYNKQKFVDELACCHERSIEESCRKMWFGREKANKRCERIDAIVSQSLEHHCSPFEVKFADRILKIGREIIMRHSYHKDDNMINMLTYLLNEYSCAIEEYSSSNNPHPIYLFESQIYSILFEHYPYAAKVFLNIITRIHELIDNEEYLDITDFEDDLIWIHNRIKQLEQRGNWDWETLEEYEFDSSDWVPGSSTYIFDSSYEMIDEEELSRRLERQDRRRAYQSRVNAIIQYIRERSKPVQRATLFANFSDCTDNLITYVCTNKNILNYYGEYFWAGNLDVSESELVHLGNAVSSCLCDNEIHHIDDLFLRLSSQFDQLFRNAYVRTSYQLLSLLKYLFPTQYNFLRPFVALKNIAIPTIPERVIQFAKNRKEVEIDEITEFCRAKGIVIAKLTDLFDSIDDFFILLNHNKLISLETLTISPDSIDDLEERIKEELENVPCLAIRELKCLSTLPRLSETVRWDEWLVYSIVRKYCKGIFTHTTSPQFRFAIPVLSLSKSIPNDYLLEIAKHYADSIDQSGSRDVDDLDLIDDLIDDMIDIDWEDIDDFEF